VTTAEAALKQDPDLELYRSRPNLFGRVMGALMIWRQLRGRGLMPWYFYTTMQKRDRRRPRMDQGLGVVEGGRAVFYPLSALRGGLRDDWRGRELHVFVRDVDRIPSAEWSDGGRPFQLFTRWYGFSFTYPGCEIRGEPASA
jgi:hypothetical protein